VGDVDAQPVAAFMVLMLVAAYAAAEGFVRRARAHDTRVAGPPEGRLMSQPWSSGPYR
jgi:hypothetical protein